MTPNEKIIKAFCDQFSPPLRYAKTNRVNNLKIADAWTTSVWDQDRGLGITCVAFNGQIHAYLEAAGGGDAVPENAGKVFAKAWGLLKQLDAKIISGD